MPESIDWPRTQSPHGRRGRRFILILAVLVGILFVGRAALSYYVDVLWFGSLSYADVFWKTLSLQWGVFAAFAAATFLIVYGSFLALKRVHLPDLPSGHTILIGGQPLKLPVEPVLRLIRSEEHTSELQSLRHLVCRLLLEKKKNMETTKKWYVKDDCVRYSSNLCLCR